METRKKQERAYIIIDLKSFYASCECADRGLPAMTTDLVVADPTRGRGTLCLAVSPSLKAKGVKNRCRVFEIPPHLRYIMAPPRMQLYINYAAEIYGIYLDFFAKEDIFVYSVDEAFIDVTNYLALYRTTPLAMAKTLLGEIERRLALPATCGIGTNLYLAKIALDITAKHAPDCIGILDEARFRETLWHHQPLTDFWRIGRGTERRLRSLGLSDMGAVAHAPFPLLRKQFGIDAEILYDHAWGREPTTIADIKAYHPKTHSVSESQVLLRDYAYSEALVVLKEMAAGLSLELLRRGVMTKTVTLAIGYSQHPDSPLPPTGGTASLPIATNAESLLREALVTLYRKTTLHAAIRHISITAADTRSESAQEISLFAPLIDTSRERRRQKTVLAIKERFGKNAILEGIDFLAAGTARERNEQIGGHRKGKEEETHVKKRPGLAQDPAPLLEPGKDIPALRRPRRTAGSPPTERSRTREPRAAPAAETAGDGRKRLHGASSAYTHGHL